MEKEKPWMTMEPSWEKQVEDEQGNYAGHVRQDFFNLCVQVRCRKSRQQFMAVHGLQE